MCELIHHAMVVAQIFTLNKGIMKTLDNGEKNFGKDCGIKDTKTPGNKDQRANGNKKKDSKKEYKGQNKLSLEDLEKYWKENWCFRCGK